MCNSYYIMPVNPRGGGGGDTQMKGAEMLVVSLRGVNFGFWSHLGCSGPLSGLHAKKYFKKLYIFNLFYSFDSWNQNSKWSLFGVIKWLSHSQIGLL